MTNTENDLLDLDPTEAVALTAMMSNPKWRYTEIREALIEDHGLDISSHTLARHARGECLAKTRLR